MTWRLTQALCSLHTRARLCDDVDDGVEDAHEEDSEDVVGAREEPHRHVMDHDLVLDLDPVRVVRVIEVLHLLELKISIHKFFITESKVVPMLVNGAGA